MLQQLIVLGSAAAPAVPADELSQLGQKYGTDKVGHRYTRLYSRLFGGSRHTLRSFLEVGVYRGASIRMWKDYFTSAELYGIDYFRNQLGVIKLTPASGLNRALRRDLMSGHNFSDEVRRGELGPRVHVIDANQSDASEMAGVVRSLGRRNAIDLIIEDGSHRHRDQLLNLAWLFPLVRPGGVYVIEDVTSSFQHGYDEPPKSEQTTLRVMERFNTTRRMTSKHMSAAERCYLERWVQSAETVLTRTRTASGHPSALCLVRKLESRGPARCDV